MLTKPVSFYPDLNRSVFSHASNTQNGVVGRNAAILNFSHSSADLNDISILFKFCQVHLLSYISVKFHSFTLIIEWVIRSQVKTIFFGPPGSWKKSNQTVYKEAKCKDRLRKAKAREKWRKTPQKERKLVKKTQNMWGVITKMFVCWGASRIAIRDVHSWWLLLLNSLKHQSVLIFPHIY